MRKALDLWLDPVWDRDLVLEWDLVHALALVWELDLVLAWDRDQDRWLPM